MQNDNIILEKLNFIRETFEKDNFWRAVFSVDHLEDSIQAAICFKKEAHEISCSLNPFNTYDSDKGGLTSRTVWDIWEWNENKIYIPYCPESSFEQMTGYSSGWDSNIEYGCDKMYKIIRKELIDFIEPFFKIDNPLYQSCFNRLFDEWKKNRNLPKNPEALTSSACHPITSAYSSSASHDPEEQKASEVRKKFF